MKLTLPLIKELANIRALKPMEKKLMQTFCRGTLEVSDRKKVPYALLQINALNQGVTRYTPDLE